MAKCIVLGSSKFTASLAKGVLDSQNDISCVISIPESKRPDNSYDLQEMSKELCTRYCEFDDINSTQAIDFIKDIKPDFIISSWPKIIKNELLNLAYIIGTHPSDLPRDKGRHPVQWHIVRGIKESKLSFFRMDSSIDSGDLILQLNYKISRFDDINSINSKIEHLARVGIGQILSSKKIKTTPQQGASNYLRARNIHDCLIDPRMNYKDIDRLVRSFASPYPCAKLIIKDQILSINKCSLVARSNDLGCGKVIEENPHFIILQCSDSIIKLYFKSDLAYIASGGGVDTNTKFLYPKIFYQALIYQNLQKRVDVWKNLFHTSL